MQINAEQTKRQESTDVLPHIYPWADKTHIHRPAGWGVGGDSSGCVGILLTWCQGLNSVGSASRRQPPRRARSIYAALPPTHPTQILWHFKFHSMDSFVKYIHPLSPFNHKKMSFSGSAIEGATWTEVGPQGERAVKTGTSFPIQLPVHLPEPSYNVFMCHSFFLKLQRD